MLQGSFNEFVEDKLIRAAQGQVKRLEFSNKIE
jgi:hypothetical protein